MNFLSESLSFKCGSEMRLNSFLNNAAEELEANDAINQPVIVRLPILKHRILSPMMTSSHSPIEIPGPVN